MTHLQGRQAARKARKTHKIQQRMIRAETQGSNSANQQTQAPQSPRKKIRDELKDKIFAGNVNIETFRGVALATAVGEVGDCTDRLVYWTDGSGMDTRCGIGIAHCFSGEIWTRLCWRLRKSAPMEFVEAYAIAKALEVALDYCREFEVGAMAREVVIYSDCPSALALFAAFKQTLERLKKEIQNGEILLGPGILATHSLMALGVKVELRYVPGHAGVGGTLMAHCAARQGARGTTKNKSSSLLIQGIGGVFRLHS